MCQTCACSTRISKTGRRTVTFVTCSRQELPGLPGDVGSADPRDAIRGDKLDVAGSWDVHGQAAARSDADVSVVSGADDQGGYGQIDRD